MLVLLLSIGLFLALVAGAAYWVARSLNKTFSDAFQTLEEEQTERWWGI